MRSSEQPAPKRLRPAFPKLSARSLFGREAGTFRAVGALDTDSGL